MFIRIKAIELKNRWKFTSRIGKYPTWGNYYSQYKNVIDEIVNGIENNTPIDTVSMPLLFLIRHSLELALKDNILELEKVNTDVDKIKLSGMKYHSIQNLFNKYIEHLNILKTNSKITETISKEINDYLNKFKPLKDTFHKLDESSISFRYPINSKGNNNFKADEQVIFFDIIDLYYSVQPLLIFTKEILYEEGVFGFEEYDY